MDQGRQTNDDRILALLGLAWIVVAEHLYVCVSVGDADPQAQRRFAYYVLSQLDPVPFLLAADRYFAGSDHPEAVRIGRFACWMMIAEKIITCAGGLTAWGVDVTTRGWAGRALELWGLWPFAVAGSFCLVVLWAAWKPKGKGS